MANMKLTIQHGNTVYEPPIKDGVKLEWERTSVPGKLTFTVLKTEGLAFEEGNPVCFYYDDKPVFMGYVFKKKRDREHHIEVTCYDQLRYFKNKYTYVFENKTASQIVQALCNDFKLTTGTMDNTNYIIPAIAEENKSAFDISLSVLEETLLNTGEMFVLYDDFGKLQLRNCANMISTTLIMEDTAENFDYTSSIDDETYNQVVLYYKNDKEIQQIYTATSPSRVSQWGLLRYFEEVKNPTIGQNKADSLLKLYNKKTRELKVTGAFGDVTVRGGTLIPVRLNLGDVTTNNFMIVQQVTHTFENDRHTMDLTLDGAWEDAYTDDMVSQTIGEIVDKSTTTDTTDTTGTDVTVTTNSQEDNRGCLVEVQCNGIKEFAGIAYISCITTAGHTMNRDITMPYGDSASAKFNTAVQIIVEDKYGYSHTLSGLNGDWKSESGEIYKLDENGIRVQAVKSTIYSIDKITKDYSFILKWVS